MRQYRVELLRQSESGAPFEPWCDVDPHCRGLASGQELWASASDHLEPISAYRFVFTFPFAPAGDVLVQHAAFPRMKRVGSGRVEEDFSEGERSPLTASYHFDERIGAQSFGLFPALTLIFDRQPAWLVSPLTESRDRASFSWKRLSDGSVELTLQFDLWALGKRPPSFGAFESERVYVELFDPGCAFGPASFQGVRKAWAERLDATNRAQTRDELFWGSWNDGHYRNIDECRILDNARWIRENLPNVAWIQIDDGWAGPGATVAGSVDNDCASLDISDLGALYRLANGTLDPRFPRGLGGLARKIKELGLRPMIWLTPCALETSPLYQDHPDWFQREARLHFFRELRFLDFSNLEAQEFVRGAFDLVFHQWGFEGAKLDYWSMGFDQADAEVSVGDQSSVQQMQGFLDLLREFVGQDGLLVYGIDLPFGSPFRSRWFDQFRYYADSEGSCQSMDAMREQALWAAFLVGLYEVQRDFWVPDGDGLGLFDHFKMPENHYRLWASFLLGSGTLTELAGWLHLKDRSRRRDELVRYAGLARLGRRVSCPGYDYLGAAGNPPFVWVRHDSEDSKLISITNWDRSSSEIDICGTDLEVEEGSILIDVLSGEEITLPAKVGVGGESGRCFTWAARSPTP